MANIGAAKSRKFAIGTSELRIGPLSSAGKLTQDYTVGLVDSVVLSVEQTVVDLKGGFPQTIMDSAVTDQSAQVTATCREFSRRNLGIMLNQGLAYVSDDDTNDAKTTLSAGVAPITATAAAVSGGTLTVTYASQTAAPYNVGDTVVLAGFTPSNYNGSYVVTACDTTTVAMAAGSASGTCTVQGTVSGSQKYIRLTSATGFTNPSSTAWGGWISIYNPASLGLCVMTRIASLSGTTATLDTAFPVPDTFASGSVVAKLAPVIVGNVTSVPYFSAQLVSLDRASGRPRIWNLWKVANGSGLSLSQGVTDFGTTEMVLKVMQPSIADYSTVTSPLYHIRNLIEKYPMGVGGEVSDDTAGY